MMVCPCMTIIVERDITVCLFMTLNKNVILRQWQRKSLKLLRGIGGIQFTILLCYNLHLAFMGADIHLSHADMY